MPVRKYKPTTPGRRGSSVSSFDELTRAKPEKSLDTPLSGVRQSLGSVIDRAGAADVDVAAFDLFLSIPRQRLSELSLDLRAHWPISGNQVDDVVREARHDVLDEPRHSFPSDEAAQGDENERVGVEAKFAHQCVTVSCSLGRGHILNPDAGVDDDDLRGIDSEPDCRRFRGRADRDDPIGLRQ